ncbi:hypothetical protein DFH07DRAFT_755920 [Mycena maculata]|uniref:3-hydroxyacyl-CoA dehydrogenase n=1 Tax=Mycena maculata TaxID=230809 RepID=A0AAD7MS92_9AGAR|nr:hypothetical protein DFH07DRAFT_755920 [Mycena maculata]
MPYRQLSSVAGRPFVVLGAGVLGRRVAMMWLTRGESVHLVDPSAKALTEGSRYISENLGNFIAAHVPDGKPGKLATFQDRAEAIKSAWIVVAVVPENVSLETRLLGELDAILPPDCILASNSSSTGSEIFEKVQNKERLINTHYMPPQLLPLQIMPNPYTDPAVVTLLLNESVRHGLQAYHESAGLIFNRIWAAMTRESLQALAQKEAGAEHVDALMKNVLGMNHGVFEMLNNVGLDVALEIETQYACGRATQIHLPVQETAKDRVVFLDIAKGEIQSLSVDGRERKTLIAKLPSLPDGVQIDNRPGKGHIYWTSMGTNSNTNSGFLSRCNMDGSDVTTIVPPGATCTPKQLVLRTQSEYLYWSDREGASVWRCKLDGSQLETLYRSATTAEQRQDPRTWCVGIALDKQRGLVYWTQRGPPRGNVGRILRASVDPPADSSPEMRTDVEVLFNNLPEPIDLECHDGFLYWTDRGEPPFGNSLNRADVSEPLRPTSPPRGPSRDLVIAEHFHEPIGLTIDHVKGKVYVADLFGSVWVTELDGTHKTALLSNSGNFTGITFCPAK